MDNKYGVTKYGFRRKLYPECLAERIKRAKDTFGVNIDTSETSFLGKLIRNMAWDETALWELAEDVYHSAFVHSTEGTSLDNVGMYLTITRRPATKSKGIITIEGDQGVYIPKGYRISTDDGILFETVESAEIGTSGSVEIPIESIDHGKGTNVSSGRIYKVVNPLMGVKKAYNSDDTEGGLNVETDDEFRDRYHKSYSRAGGSTLPAITASLLDLDHVIDAEVKENVEMVEQEGIPPKSIACYVYGTATDEEIAETIYQNKAGGIQAFGDCYVEVKDKMGISHNIGFTRAKVQDIYIRLMILKDEGYKGDDIIKRAIINYIGGIDNDGVEYKGLKLGQDVIHSKLIGVIMCLGGVAEVKAELSLDGVDYKEENIVIPKHTIARIDPERIVITHDR